MLEVVIYKIFRSKTEFISIVYGHKAFLGVAQVMYLPSLSTRPKELERTIKGLKWVEIMKKGISLFVTCLR